MTKTSKKKSSEADLLVRQPSPVKTPNRSPTESPKIFEFNSSCFSTPTNSSSSLKDGRSNDNSSEKPASEPPMATSPAPTLLSLSAARSRIADLKEMTSSRMNSIKRHIDGSFSDILKDMEVSHSRVHKRIKKQNESCEQTMDEAEKDLKKMNDQISETHDALEASYMDLMTEAQARATRMCKTTIPQLSQSVEKAIDALRSRYGAASTSS